MATRRERQKREEQKQRNQEWKENLSPFASDHLNHLDDLPEGIDVVFVSRVSTPKQAKNGDLNDQINTNVEAIQKTGRRVVGKVKHTGSGSDPSWLKKAVRLARKMNATAIVAESTDRFIRNPIDYRSPPRKEDYERLKVATEGFLLDTVLHPDATQEEVWSYQRKRGQQGKQNKGGRPPTFNSKKKRRETLLPKALELREQGTSLGRIAATLNVCKATVQKWVKQGKISCIGR